MTVDAAVASGVDVVRIAGDVDTSTIEELWPLVQTRIEQTLRAVVVELSEVTFFGSAGISVLVSASGAAQERGVGFAVAATQARVLKPLRLTGVDELLTIRADVATAITAAVPAAS